MSTNAWRCRIIEEPSNWSLHVESGEGLHAENLTVLLDDVPARDQPTVYKIQEMPGATAERVRLRIAFVPVRGWPQFDTIEIQWSDERQRRQTYRTSVTACVERWH